MNEQECKDFVYKEIEAIYEELDKSVNQLVLIKKFLKKAIEVSKGKDLDYDNLIKIINRLK